MFENVNIHDILKFGDYVGNPHEKNHSNKYKHAYIISQVVRELDFINLKNFRKESTHLHGNSRPWARGKCNHATTDPLIFTSTKNIATLSKM